MTITSLSAEAIAGLSFEPVLELPPYNEYLPGPPAELAHVVGTEGEPGSVAVVRLPAGGIRFLKMPIVSLSTIVAGRLTVADADGEHTFGPGDGFATPADWSGELRVEEAVTMLLIVV